MNQTPRLTLTIDETELAVRIFEATLGTKRPIGMSAQVAWHQMSPDQRGQAQRAARAALDYFQQCIKGSGKEN